MILQPCLSIFVNNLTTRISPLQVIMTCTVMSKRAVYTVGIKRVTLLWPPYGIGQAITFLRCGFFFFFFLLSFFPRLISAVADWMSTILPHMVWP